MQSLSPEEMLVQLGESGGNALCIAGILKAADTVETFETMLAQSQSLANMDQALRSSFRTLFQKNDDVRRRAIQTLLQFDWANPCLINDYFVVAEDNEAFLSGIDVESDQAKLFVVAANNVMLRELKLHLGLAGGHVHVLAYLQIAQEEPFITFGKLGETACRQIIRLDLEENQVLLAPDDEPVVIPLSEIRTITLA